MVQLADHERGRLVGGRSGPLGQPAPPPGPEERLEPDPPDRQRERAREHDQDGGPRVVPDAERVVQARIVPGDQVEVRVRARGRERRLERLGTGCADGRTDDGEGTRLHRPDTLPGGTAGWERPRSGGEDGDAHRHPPRCRSRHAEMGGRSQPRPRWPDRHRRSGGRGATASAPATCGIGVVHTGTRFPCTSTPTWDVHARIGIGTPRPAVKTGLPRAAPTAIR